MSDILIRGIKKPERCFICPLKYNRGMNYYCTIKEMQGVDSCISKNTMSVVCPFSELPAHGDLISRDDAIIDVNERGYDFWNCDADIDSAVLFLNEQPVIVPASEGVE